MVSTGSDTTQGAGEAQDDLDIMKQDVKNFSLGLTKLKDLFAAEGEDRLSGKLSLRYEQLVTILWFKLYCSYGYNLLMNEAL